MASSRLTITRCLDSATAPRASVVVTIMGSISGVRPTATDSANKRACVQFQRLRPLITKTSGTMSSMSRTSIQLSRLTSWWKALRGPAGAARCCARWPSRVCLPVLSTTATPLPLSTWVPMNKRLSISMACAADSRARANFSTGSDSPVKAAWLRNKSLALTTRMSAGMRSPAASWTSSPGTSSRMGSSSRA
jgi:hypothetical protein